MQRGFTLIEALVSVAIFAIVIVAVAEIFGRSVQSYGYARAAQQAAEDASFAINRMAKSLRTSTIRYHNASVIVLYDYSRQMCVRYAIMSARVTESARSMDDVLSCNRTSLNGYPVIELTSLPTEGRFVVVPSAYGDSGNGVVGIATVVLETAAPSHDVTARVQASVSLRDYDVSGLM